MTIMTSLRLQVLQTLGAKCSRCGWCEDLRGLKIWSTTDPNPRGGYYVGWLAKILATSDKSPYRLLCANCSLIAMHKAREGKELGAVPMEQARFVWKSKLTLKDLLGAKIKWLDTHLEHGERVLIVLGSGEVVEYRASGVGQVIAERLEEVT